MKPVQESQNTLSPDARVILKKAFLVEAKALLKANPQSQERDASIRELLTEAESHGAKEIDLTLILSQIVDEEQK